LQTISVYHLRNVCGTVWIDQAALAEEPLQGEVILENDQTTRCQAVVWVGLDFGEVIEWVRKKANAVCRLIRKTICLLEQSRSQMASFLTASTEAEYLQRMHQALKTSTDGNKRQVNHLRQK